MTQIAGDSRPISYLEGRISCAGSQTADLGFTALCSGAWTPSVSVRLSVCPSVRLSVCLSAFLPAHLSVSLAVQLLPLPHIVMKFSSWLKLLSVEYLIKKSWFFPPSPAFYKDPFFPPQFNLSLHSQKIKMSPL